MCGISGYYNPKLKVNHLQKLEAMAQMSKHRGSNHIGYFKNEYLGLSYNRLRLLDLSVFGYQPLKSQNGVLVFSRELHNYEELELDNWKKYSRSEKDALFQCMNQWGVKKTLRRIEGMFAFFDLEVKGKISYRIISVVLITIAILSTLDAAMRTYVIPLFKILVILKIKG
jgi:asparagine synthase (glutamine-hydrolysing)